LLSAPAHAEPDARAVLLSRFAAFDRQVVADTASSPPGNNDRGGLAWGASYVLTAYAEMLDATHEPRYAERFIQLADGVLAQRDDRRNVTDAYRDRVVPAWSSTRYTKDKRYAWAVHTGMLTFPMARFASVVLNTPTLRMRFGTEARRILDAARESVTVHDVDWRDGPNDDEGYMVCLHLKKLLPLNQQNAIGRAWLAIDDALSEPHYRPRIEKLARFLKRRLRHDEQLDAYDWSYWPGPDDLGKGSEDISHAAINVDFAVLCRRHRIVFDATDMARFGATLTRRVWSADGPIADTVAGEGKDRHADAIYRWARLGRVNPDIRDRFIADLCADDKPPNIPQAIAIAHMVATLDAP
jgi:hypothetical protein